MITFDALDKFSPRIAARELRATAKLLETCGWIQGSLRQSNGYCLIGALQYLNCYLETAKAFDRFLKNRFGDGYDNLLGWNDDPDRTKADVIAALVACSWIEDEKANSETANAHAARRSGEVAKTVLAELIG